MLLRMHVQQMLRNLLPQPPDSIRQKSCVLMFENHQIIERQRHWRRGDLSNVGGFMRRRQKKEPVTYAHPSLEPALKRTLGVPAPCLTRFLSNWNCRRSVK
jgi:hypothetical protein